MPETRGAKGGPTSLWGVKGRTGKVPGCGDSCRRLARSFRGVQECGIACRTLDASSKEKKKVWFGKVTSAPTGASAERTGPRDLPAARAVRIERGGARASHRFLQTAGAGSGGRLAREGERFEHTSWGLINVRDGLWGFDSATGCCRSAERGGRGAWTTILDRPGNTRKSCPLPEGRKGKKHATPEQQLHHVPAKDRVEQKRLHHHSSMRITTRQQ